MKYTPSQINCSASNNWVFEDVGVIWRAPNVVNDGGVLLEMALCRVTRWWAADVVHRCRLQAALGVLEWRGDLEGVRVMRWVSTEYVGPEVCVVVAFEMRRPSSSSVNEAACGRWQGRRRSSLSSNARSLSSCVKVITRLCSYFRAGLHHLESCTAAQM